MRGQGKRFLNRLTLAQRFLLISLVTLLGGMFGIGWWVGQQIEEGVIQRTAATTALYVNSFITSQLDDIEVTNEISPQHAAELRWFLQDTPLGQQMVVFKIWSPQGRVLYHTDPTIIGQTFPVEDGLARAVQGNIAAELSNLDADENVPERAEFTQLLEMYSPVRQRGTGRVVAVAEFYQRAEDLQQEIRVAQQRSWLVVGGAACVMYLLLAGFIQRASNTILRQQSTLSTQVTQLRALLGENQELHQRVRRAAARTTALNERFLRRISAELHDGPAQDLGLALLRLDPLIMSCEANSGTLNNAEVLTQLDVVQNSVQRALQEIRVISSGLILPHLQHLQGVDILQRVVRTHELRTGTKVMMHIGDLPEEISLPVKITMYRFIQEALNNAYRHAGGVGQEVTVQRNGERLCIEVANQGPGFAGEVVADGGQHLGLVGMRERVESLGGIFHVDSAPESGTRVSALVPIQAESDLVS